MGFIAKLANRAELVMRVARAMVAKSKGVEMGRDVVIGRHVEFRFSGSPSARQSISIGDRVTIDVGCIVDAYGGSIEIGANTYIGPGSIIWGHGGVFIGAECLIAPHCLIFSSNHGIPSPEKGIRQCADVLAATKVGNDSWLGGGTAVVAGVTIGRGSVVGAGSVVTRDLADYSVSYGVPARTQRSRSSKIDEL